MSPPDDALSDPPSTDVGRSGSVLVKFSRLERIVWSSLGGWLLRRPLPVPPGGRPFGYAREGAPLLWGFIAVSALEIPLLDLLLPNWTLRIIFGVLGLWGLIWMCGLLATQYRMPHAVGPDWVRVRAGWSLDILIPWDVVSAVQQSSRLVTSSRAVQYEGDMATGARCLVVPVASRTNVTLLFRQRLEVQIAGEPQVIDEVRLWADDPAGFVKAAAAQVATALRGEA